MSGAFLLPAATGCYAYRQAPAGTLPPGGTVALGITDRGRVAIGSQLGPGALRVVGRLVEATDSSYVVRVEKVEYLNGRTSRWNGEPVTISHDDVGTAAEQHFSRARTWLAISGVAVGVALAASAISLTASGHESGGGEPPPGNQQ